MSQSIRGRGSHLVFLIAPPQKKLCIAHWYLASCQVSSIEEHELGRGRWNFASCQVSLNSVQRSQRRSRKCLSQSEARAAFLSTQITQIGRGRWDLAACQVSLNLVQRSRRRSRNVSANQRLGGHLFPPIDPKNTNLLEGVEILGPVKFCWIPFSGFRGEIENASANHRPGRLSCSSDRPEKHKRDRRRWDLASCIFFIYNIY